MPAGALILAALSCTGCYRVTFVESASDLERQPTRVEWNSHYLFGLVGRPGYDAGELCKSGIGVVRTGGDFTTGVLTIVTLGLYAPRKVYLTCARPGRSARNGSAR
jgi:hypothetical protein